MIVDGHMLHQEKIAVEFLVANRAGIHGMRTCVVRQRATLLEFLAANVAFEASFARVETRVFHQMMFPFERIGAHGAFVRTIVAVHGTPVLLVSRRRFKSKTTWFTFEFVDQRTAIGVTGRAAVPTSVSIFRWSQDAWSIQRCFAVGVSVVAAESGYGVGEFPLLLLSSNYGNRSCVDSWD